MKRVGFIAYRNPDGTFGNAKHIYKSDDPTEYVDFDLPEEPEDPAEVIRNVASLFAPYIAAAVEAGEFAQ